MAKETTSIYIDGSAIQVLVARGRQLQKWATVPLEPGMVSNGVILDEDAVADKAKELWRDQQIGSRRVVAGVSGINCLHRLITLPELPADLLPEAIKREAERVLGVPVGQLYLAWQKLPSPARETLAYLSASPRNAVDSLISTLHKAGLNPTLMDLKPLAIARTVIEPRAIVIDLQPTSFDIVIMSDRIPQVIRSVPLSSESLQEEKISLVREELNRAITFYNSSHMDKPIEASLPLLVSGELAQREDMWETLVKGQKHSVQVLPSPVDAPENLSTNQYITNIGLVLKEVLASEKGAIAYSLINFNAMPEIYIPKPRSLSEVLFMPTIIVGLVLVALGVFLNINASAHNSAMRAELANITLLTITQQARDRELSSLRDQVASLKATADSFTTTLREFAAERDAINSDLSKINSALSVGGIDLSNIIHSVDSVTVRGRGDGEDAVFRYARYLRTSGRFAQVVITSMDGDGNFTLRLTK